MKRRAFEFIKKNWAPICLLIIVLLTFYVRVEEYRWQYLRNIDSYTFARFMDDIVENGALPERDELVRSPVGTTRNFELHPYEYLGAYSFMLLRMFIPGIQMWQYLIYFPAFIAALIAIPMYFIGKALYDKKAGLLAAFFTVFDLSLVARTLAGDPDNDGFVLLIPMIVMAVFIYSYKYIERTRKFDKKFLSYSITLGILLGIWANTWIGYWYIIWIIFGLIILKVSYEMSKNLHPLLAFISALIFPISIIIGYKNKNLRNTFSGVKYILASFIIYILIMSFILTMIYGADKNLYVLRGPFEFQSIKGEEKIVFPNVYVSVAELQQSGGAREIISRTSAVQGIGILISPFFLMLYCLMYLFYSFIRKRQHIDTLFLLFIWFVGPFAATLVAVRFSILFTAPMAIGSGIILSKLIRMATGEDAKIED
ncbi:MAG: hypothetical protein HYT73_00720 [Candidatus Aenigmarchaeota archaeon]|nr:hypothetical protein [Candidatus Aenigmarchaeota archaeon]